MRALALATVLALAACTGAARDIGGDRSLLDSGAGTAVFGGVAATPGRRDTFWGFCGGAIINYGNETNPGLLSGKLVLTAAHCFEDGKTGISAKEMNPLVMVNIINNKGPLDNNNIVGQFPVGGGTQADYANAGVVRTVYGTYNYVIGNNVTFAPDKTKPASLENDIAIMLLDAQVGPPNTTPTLQIPPAGTKKAGGVGGLPGLGPLPGSTGGTMLRLVGFGKTNGITNTFPDVLQAGDYPLRNLTVCESEVPTGNANSLFANNSRICAGKAGDGPASCPGDSGGALFTVGANWVKDVQVGLVSYGVTQTDPITGLVTTQCNWKPKILTDVAAARSWIAAKIADIERTYFEYTMDIFVRLKTMNGPIYNGTIPLQTQFELSKVLSEMIGKKPSPGNSPFQVNFYSYKSASDGRIRFKWTTKKTWDQAGVKIFFTKGVYNTTCVVGTTLSDWSGGQKDCASGPFNTITKFPNQGIFWFLQPTVSYYRNTLDIIENTILETSDPSGDEPIPLKVKSITISNGYITLPTPPPAKPPCNIASSGIDACVKTAVFGAVTS
ncbi:hypothetical protein ABPG75_003597 [Micractinium tetrahymenae]